MLIAIFTAPAAVPQPITVVSLRARVGFAPADVAVHLDAQEVARRRLRTEVREGRQLDPVPAGRPLRLRRVEAGGVTMGIDLSALTDPQFQAKLDYATKQYTAYVVGELLTARPGLTASELHQLLLEQAAQAKAAARS